MHVSDKKGLSFTRDQIVTSSEASKRFGEVRKRAAKQPVFVSDRSGINTVIVDFDLFEKMTMELEALREKTLVAMVNERLANSHEPIDFEEAVGSGTYKEFMDIDPDAIPDEELFE